LRKRKRNRGGNLCGGYGGAQNLFTKKTENSGGGTTCETAHSEGGKGLKKNHLKKEKSRKSRTEQEGKLKEPGQTNPKREGGECTCDARLKTEKSRKGGGFLLRQQSNRREYWRKPGGELYKGGNPDGRTKYESPSNGLEKKRNTEEGR